MNIKRLLSLTLAAAMLPAGAVFAEETISEEKAEVISVTPIADTLEQIDAYDKVDLFGSAKIEDGILYIQSENDEIQLNLDENTVFVDENGYKTALEGIKDGQSLKIVAGSQMTMSIPAQVYAYVVIIADEQGEFPIYAEVESVDKDEDGNIFINSKDGNYRFVYSEEETQITPFATRNIVTIDDIAEGSRILVSSDIMTMSIPAIVPAKKIAVLPELVIAPAEEAAPQIPANVTINGSVINVEALKVIAKDDGSYLLPVRAICEAAGLTVDWDGTLKAITVGTTPMGVTFNIGVNKYTKAKMAAMELTAAPELINDTTYVPVDFFTELLEAEAELSGDTLNVTIK